MNVGFLKIVGRLNIHEDIEHREKDHNSTGTNIPPYQGCKSIVHRFERVAKKRRR